ncbi:MAG: hypothetical protein ACLR1M_11410 [Oscillospiraceae bacterium]
MSVKHNKDGGGNAEIKKELQEVKKETQEVKTAGESAAALLALSFKAQIAQDRAAKTNVISDAMILQSAEVIEYPEYRTRTPITLWAKSSSTTDAITRL